MDEQLTARLKYIRLWGLLENWDRYLHIGKNFSHVRLLKYIIEEECKIKEEKAGKMRLARAKIPEKFVMETFPFGRQPNLGKKKILNLYDSFNYMTKNQNMIWIGPTGTGKTGLATAFLIRAIICNFCISIIRRYTKCLIALRKYEVRLILSAILL